MDTIGGKGPGGTPEQEWTAVGAVVLAGGRSTRFGADKTRALFEGRALLDRVLDVVSPLVTDVVVVGDWAPPGVRLVAEPTRGLGPLAGLAHGLHQVGTPHALVLAGDHPVLQPALLQLLLDHAAVADRSVDAVVPIGPHGPEPLVAWYRGGVAAVADLRISDGQRSLRGLLDAMRTEWIERVAWSIVDPHGLSFRDVDTSRDLADLESGPER